MCPNDLLLGRTSIRAPIGTHLVNEGFKNRLEFMERIVNGFWKKWHRDYFPTLIVRQKWHVDRRNVSIGDVVIVQDTNSLRGQWKLAQVIEVESSRDGKVRDVTLRYKLKRPGVEYKGQRDVHLKRSVHRLVVLLPVEEFKDQ